MPDFNNFAGRGFREGRFRDVGGGAPGSGGNVPPQRKKPPETSWPTLKPNTAISFLKGLQAPENLFFPTA